MPRAALIDFDILVYRIGFALEQDVWEVCTYILDKTIREICAATNSQEYEGFLTGSGNFRHEVAFTKGYKENRKDAPKPSYYGAIREYLLLEHGAVLVDGMEADDALGLRQTDDTIICSIDKDLLMIPGLHYNFVKGETSTVGEHEGMLRFYKQLMMGDSTDNIPGIPGIGNKRSDQVIIDCECDLHLIWGEIQDMYHSHYVDNWAGVLQEQADLLWIRRAGWERYVTSGDPKTGE